LSPGARHCNLKAALASDRSGQGAYSGGMEIECKCGAVLNLPLPGRADCACGESVVAIGLCDGEMFVGQSWPSAELLAALDAAAIDLADTELVSTL
jgi:hypothetical protein